MINKEILKLLNDMKFKNKYQNKYASNNKKNTRKAKTKKLEKRIIADFCKYCGQTLEWSK